MPPKEAIVAFVWTDIVGGWVGLLACLFIGMGGKGGFLWKGFGCVAPRSGENDVGWRSGVTSYIS